MARKVWSGFCLGRRKTVEKRHLEGKKGGPGKEQWKEDQEVVNFLKQPEQHHGIVMTFSLCTYIPGISLFIKTPNL